MTGSADGYAKTFASWKADPERFWLDASAAIEWDRAPSVALDPSATPLARWFPDGELNTCFNALDRHVRDGRGDQLALVYDSPVTGKVVTYSYQQLLDTVARFAGALAREGVERGDRVVIYMPMVPEAVIAMLACARIGAVHSVVFGGFGAPELAARIADCQAKLVVCASCGIGPAGVIAYKPLVDEALRLVDGGHQRCIVLQRPEGEGTLVPGRDVDWHEALDGAEPVPCVSVRATDPLYILYTSGTTGLPKGVVRDNGGHAVALEWSMGAVYDVQPGEVFWAASDIGWVVGHSYIVYAPLLHGCTTVLYEGKPVGTPDAGAFWRVCADHKVNVLFTAPTAIRAIKREDPEGELLRPYDLSALRTLFLAGERCDPDTLSWAGQHLDRPVIDHWWQTESGWPMAANCLGLERLPVKPGSATKPVPGYDIHVLDADGHDVPAGESGAICVRLPLPPGFAPTLWRADDRFTASYLSAYPGWYLTADAGYFDEDGYLFIMSRTDDVINVAGHRLSTGQIEEVLASHPDVAECAVVGVADALKGQVPIGFAVLKAGVTRPNQAIEAELVALVRKQVGPVAAFKSVGIVRALPKTRSGKILRSTIRRIIDGEEWQAPPTIEDATVLDQFEALATATPD
ncbi:MAG: propionyl-CoA synthetase [Actinomycetota bacterium]|nr:propionyl-CoA synthetase [Actinomycetota bacterium]MDA8294683.1 propionyl-CoA synthetase [Actinomycetota bacterium]